MTEPLIDAVTRHMAEIMTESQALRHDVQAAERARRRAGMFNLAVLLILAVALALVVGLVWQNNRITRQVGATNRAMLDCTTPGGTCYRQGQERTAAAVGDILRVSIFMAECSRLYPGEAGPEFDRKLERCVADKLAAQDKTNPVPPAPSAVPSPPVR